MTGNIKPCRHPIIQQVRNGVTQKVLVSYILVSRYLFSKSDVDRTIIRNCIEKQDFGKR
jgi:hypothetical protein